MMAMKISYHELQIISKCLLVNHDEFAQQLHEFLKIQQDDYYFYGREPDCVKVLEIKTWKLKQILDNNTIKQKQFESAYKNIQSIYLAAITSFLDSVFLFGRNRIE